MEEEAGRVLELRGAKKKQPYLRTVQNVCIKLFFFRIPEGRRTCKDQDVDRDESSLLVRELVTPASFD